MYQQGNPGDGMGRGDEWSTRPPRKEVSDAPRRRRSQSRNDRPAREDGPAAPVGRGNPPMGQQGYAPQPQPGYRGGYDPRQGDPRQGDPRQGGYMPQQNGYGPNGYAPGQGGYADPGYAPRQGGYVPRQNGYADQGYAPRQSGYAEQGYAPQQNGYADQGYMPQQSGYTDQGYMPQQSGYADQGYMPQQNGYAEQGYMPQQSGYADQGYMPQQNGYADQGYMPQQSGYADPGGYDPRHGDYDVWAEQEYPGSMQEEPKSFFVKNAKQIAAIALVLGIVALWAAFGNRGGSSPTGNGNPPVQAGVATNAPVNVSRGDASAYAGLFLPNVYVDGICLADMTYEEGSAAVWQQVNNKQNSWYVRLTNENGSYKDITAGMLGISFDPSSALQQAWAVGHPTTANGQVDQKALIQAVSDALATEYHFTSARQSADTSPIDTILNTLQTNAYRSPQDAVILSFNPDDFVNPFTFQQEVWGQWLDISAVKQEILDLVSTMESGEVMLKTTPIAPTVTVADLQKTVTLRCRAVTPISSSSTEERTNNIRVAFERINGKSFAHGDKFSFNKLVGRRSTANGFYEAIEYAYGEEVMGVGGGVCQASTTVYLAAIQSGMTITSRDAHSNPVNYTSLGMDATVSDTRGREVDFAFKNESGGRIFIAAHVVESGSNRRSLLCEVRIYGPSLENVYYRLESETVEVIPKPEEPKLKEDKTGEKAYYVDEMKLASKGREGYVVDTYLCTYQDDVLISRDKVSTDTYPARQDVMWVGVNLR